MKTELVGYEHKGAKLEAYVAYEEGPPRPGVLIFHAWGGRDAFVMEKAEMLAKLGYVGCAMDVYGKGVLGGSMEENSALMEPFMKDRKLLRDRMGLGMETMVEHPMIDRKRMGAMGFCFGGLCALDLARSGADIKGVVSFHGLLHRSEELKQETIKAKILVLHGFDDPMVPAKEVREFENEMNQASVDWQLHAYGNTMHAFTNPTANNPDVGIVYSPVVEKRALLSMQNFFQEVL